MPLLGTIILLEIKKLLLICSMVLHKCGSSDESFPPPTAQQAVSSREKSEAAVSTKACAEVTVSPMAG